MDEKPSVDTAFDANPDETYAFALRSKGLTRGDILARLVEERGLTEDDALAVLAKLPIRQVDETPAPKPKRPVDPAVARARRIGIRNMQVGGTALALGSVFTLASYSIADHFGGFFLVAQGAIALGGIGLLGGLIQFLKGSE